MGFHRILFGNHPGIRLKDYSFGIRFRSNSHARTDQRRSWNSFQPKVRPLPEYSNLGTETGNNPLDRMRRYVRNKQPDCSRP